MGSILNFTNRDFFWKAIDQYWDVMAEIFLIPATFPGGQWLLNDVVIGRIYKSKKYYFPIHCN